MAKKRLLGEILREMGVIDEMQLSSALAHHRQWGMPLAQALVEKKFCTAEQVLAALSRQAGLQLFDLDAHPLPPANSRLLPERIAEQFRAVPLRLEGKRAEVLVIAIAAPGSLQSLDAIQAVTGKQRVVPFLASDGAIARAIGRLYRNESGAPAATIAYAPARGDNELEVDLDGGGGFAPRPARSSTPPSTTPAAAEGLDQLTLSANCRAVLARAAAHFRLSERQLVERVLEAWAAKQQ